MANPILVITEGKNEVKCFISVKKQNLVGERRLTNTNVQHATLFKTVSI